MLDVRLNDGELELLISWLGFNKEDDSWEPADAMFEFVPRVVLDALQQSDLPEAATLIATLTEE